VNGSQLSDLALHINTRLRSASGSHISDMVRIGEQVRELAASPFDTLARFQASATAPGTDLRIAELLHDTTKATRYREHVPIGNVELSLRLAAAVRRDLSAATMTRHPEVLAAISVGEAVVARDCSMTAHQQHQAQSPSYVATPANKKSKLPSWTVMDGPHRQSDTRHALIQRVRFGFVLTYTRETLD